LHVSLGSPPHQSVILSFVTSCILIFKIVQTQTVTVIITQTKKPRHLPSQSRLFQPGAKPNCTSSLHFKESSLLHSLLPLCRLSGNAIAKQRMTQPSCSPGTVNNLAVLKALGSIGVSFPLFKFRCYRTTCSHA